MFRQEGSTLIWQRNGETVWVQPWGKDSLRVRATRGQAILDTTWGLLPAAPGAAKLDITESGATVSNGAITAHMAAGGRLSFVKSAGHDILCEETEPGHFFVPPARGYSAISSDLYRCDARFSAYEGERFYGLGQHQHGLLDQKGCVIELMQRNTEVSIPFLLSSRGYGFLWHNPAVGRVELAANGTRWVAEASRQIDYWITAGGHVRRHLGALR